MPKKGYTWKKHKYVKKRITKNGKTLYVYGPSDGAPWGPSSGWTDIEELINEIEEMPDGEEKQKAIALLTAIMRSKRTQDEAENRIAKDAMLKHSDHGIKYCRIVRSGEPFLAHHGIDGQKWGVRNGPPYPLDRETHTRIIRKGYERDRDLLNRGKLSKLKIEGSKHYIDTSFDHQWTEVINATDLPDNKHNVAHWMQDPNLSNNFRIDNEVDMSWANIAKFANFDFGEAGTTNNCKKCTAAVEMRKRGWNVMAGRSFFGGQTQAMSYWFDGAVQYKEQGVDNISNRLEKTFGNNGRGELTFRYPDGGGHSVYCYRDKEGCHMIDGQSGKRYAAQDWKNLLDDVHSVYGFDKNASFTATRLDTATPNLKHMEDDSVLRMVYRNMVMNQIYNSKKDTFGAMFDQRTDANVPLNYRQYTRDMYNQYFNEDMPDGQYGYRVKSEPWNQGSSLLRFTRKW